MLCPEPYGAMRLMRHNAQRRAVQQMVAETRRRMTQQGCMARMKCRRRRRALGAWAAKTPDGARAGNRAAAMRRRRRAILAASPRHHGSSPTILRTRVSRRSATETTEEASAGTNRGGGGLPPSRVTLRADTEEEAAAVETKYVYRDDSAPAADGWVVMRTREGRPLLREDSTGVRVFFCPLLFFSFS
ncbi:hypothetical protein TcBrA4_0048490 [Trypanosoma cruzi]|nr:hypothetical protein TcBrA4_0048490 [Trypanosoma cruzi]